MNCLIRDLVTNCHQLENSSRYRHSHESGNPARKQIPRSGQNLAAVLLRGGLFNQLDSRFRGNDVVQVFTQQFDYQAARKYWNKLKERFDKECSQSVTDCHRLKLFAARHTKKIA